MGAVMDVFAKYGLAIDEDDFAAVLDSLLNSGRQGFGVDLAAPELVYLEQFADVPEVGSGELAALDAGAAERAAVEALNSLSQNAVATLLGLPVSGVSHLVTDGASYTVALGGGPSFPDWQFNSDADGKAHPLPGLKPVLRAIPEGSHPISVRRFMTTPLPELLVDGVPRSPRAWLTESMDPTVVADLAVTLGEQG